MTVVPDGNPCGCGNYGCLEKHASATAITAMARLLQLGDDLTRQGSLRSGHAKATKKAQMDFRGAWARRWELRWQTSSTSSIFRCILLSGGVLAAWDLFSPRMMAEVRKALVHLPQRKDTGRKGGAGQRSGALRRRLSTLGGSSIHFVRTSYMYWLGIDIGTGGSRALLVDAGTDKWWPASRRRTKRCGWSGPCGPSSARKTGGRLRRGAIRGVLAEAGVAGPRSRASASPARCTAW